MQGAWKAACLGIWKQSLKQLGILKVVSGVCPTLTSGELCLLQQLCFLIWKIEEIIYALHVCYTCVFQIKV